MGSTKKPWFFLGERQHSERIDLGRFGRPDACRPNLLLIGAPRCASTSLAFALEKHPDIFGCTPKEPHFLAMHGLRSEISGVGNEVFSKGTQLSHGQWAELFEDRTERYLMDASVSTISYPETSIENIKEFCDPNVKIIVILRNPAERAFSSYMYCRSKGWATGTFEECLAFEQYRLENNWQHLWFLRYLSQYELRLRPFLDAFGSDNVHVAITEEFSNDPDTVLRDIFRYLGLPAVGIDASVRYNQSGTPNALLGDLSAFIRRRPFLLKSVKRFSTRWFREVAKNKSLLRSEMAEDSRKQLATSLTNTKPWVERLIGRSLPSWD